MISEFVDKEQRKQVNDLINLILDISHDNERLRGLEKTYKEQMEHFKSIEGINVIEENKELKKRVKELEQICSWQGIEINTVHNAYVMLQEKVKDVFIEPSLINDIYCTEPSVEGDEFVISVFIDLREAKKKIGEEKIKEYE